MRADRLISLLMLLEARGSITAKELAQELDVNQRTIYRDIEALCYAGVPIYGATGPRGGYSLVDGYRSYLNGLSKLEMHALLSLNVHEYFTDLEIGGALKSAIRKLQSHYHHISQNDIASMDIYIDPRGWSVETSKSSHLNILHKAISNCNIIEVTYQASQDNRFTISKIVKPYGLVFKESRWYLVYGTEGGTDVLETLDILDVQETEVPFTKDLNLKEFWQEWCYSQKHEQNKFQVTVLIHQAILDKISVQDIEAGKLPALALPIEPRDWVKIQLTFRTFDEARSKLLALGRAVKVIEPDIMIDSLKDYAEQVLSFYHDTGTVLTSSNT